MAARSFFLQRTVPPQAAQSAAKNYCELPQAVRSPEKLQIFAVFRFSSLCLY
jgi:hypothetical protein